MKINYSTLMFDKFVEGYLYIIFEDISLLHEIAKQAYRAYYPL